MLPREVQEAIDSLNHVHAEATWAGHMLGVYLTTSEHTKEHHEAVRATARDVSAAARLTIAKFEAIVTAAKKAEKERAKRG